ncbi:hypothetical protein Q5P01_000682 [Channa striata]|uniref:Uncharacterized protein n=1 Tax=Channa striata TaxID=64152 RepID=A0AA88IGK8_CHASR|nr:hypothetical protein Q5P01_000682 [Channa striata]
MLGRPDSAVRRPTFSECARQRAFQCSLPGALRREQLEDKELQLGPLCALFAAGEGDAREGTTSRTTTRFSIALGCTISPEARSASREKEVTDPGWLDRAPEEHAPFTALLWWVPITLLSRRNYPVVDAAVNARDDEPTGVARATETDGRRSKRPERRDGRRAGGGRSAEVAPRAETDRDRAGEHPPMTERTRATKEGEDGGKELGEKDAPLSRAVSAKPAPCGNYTYHEFNNLAGTLTDGPKAFLTRSPSRWGSINPVLLMEDPVDRDTGKVVRRYTVTSRGHLSTLARNSALENASDAPCYNEVFLPGRPVSRLNLDVDLKCCLGCSARFSSGRIAHQDLGIPALVSSASRHSGVPAEIGEGEAQRARGGPAISRTWETRWVRSPVPEGPPQAQAEHEAAVVPADRTVQL